MAELYRHYDRDGVLLYVGISASTFTRVKQHKSESHWFRRITAITIEHFETMSQAAESERLAIKSEKPLYNKTHVKRDGKPSTCDASRVAKMVGVSRKTFYNMLEDGRFAIAPIPGTQPRRWRVADVEAVWGRKA
jgi:predicted DNA-binding transcriptional regulator AlpA